MQWDVTCIVMWPICIIRQILLLCTNWYEELEYEDMIVNPSFLQMGIRFWSSQNYMWRVSSKRRESAHQDFCLGFLATIDCLLPGCLATVTLALPPLNSCTIIRLSHNFILSLFIHGHVILVCILCYNYTVCVPNYFLNNDHFHSLLSA